MEVYVAHANYGYEGLSEPKYVTKELSEIQAYLRGFKQVGIAVGETEYE